MTSRKPKPELSDEILCAEYESVYRYVLTLCRDDTDAQDITQETFLKAIKAADRFQGNSSLYTWLCAIAKNLWLNKYKEAQRVVSSDCTSQSSIPLEQYFIDQDLSMRVHLILHQLDEPYKEVFCLDSCPFLRSHSCFPKPKAGLGSLTTVQEK